MELSLCRRKNLWLYVLYAIAAAAILKKQPAGSSLLAAKKRPLTFRDGVAYGLGHGGIEALFVGIVSLLNFLGYSSGSDSGECPDAGSNSSSSYWQCPFHERWQHLSFGFWTDLGYSHSNPSDLLGLESGQGEGSSVFLAALGLHALIDLAPALAQVGVLPPLAVEALLLSRSSGTSLSDQENFESLPEGKVQSWASVKRLKP